jgi:hypothetical protein
MMEGVNSTMISHNTFVNVATYPRTTIKNKKGCLVTGLSLISPNGCRQLSSWGSRGAGVLV